MAKGDQQESRQVKRRLEIDAAKRGISVDELRAERAEKPGLLTRRNLLFAAVGMGGAVAAEGLGLTNFFNANDNVEVVEYSSDLETSAGIILEFEEYVAAESKKRFVIVDFHSEACHLCHQMSSILGPAAEDTGENILILKVVTADVKGVATNLEPVLNYLSVGDSYPEIQIFRDRERLGDLSGAVPSKRALSRFIEDSAEAWLSSLTEASLERGVGDNGFDLIPANA